MPLLRHLLWVFLVLASLPVSAQEETAPAPTHYRGRRIANYMHHSGATWLIRRNREKEENTSLLLK